MSKKEFPKYESTLMSDDIREEKFNKISLIGLYSDEIWVDPDGQNKILPKLCFYTRVRGGEGVFSTACSLIDPDGEELLENAVFANLTAHPDKIANLSFILSPFRADKEGEYKYSILFDGKKNHTFKFKVIFKKPVSNF